jgi:hypothetical protein
MGQLINPHERDNASLLSEILTNKVRKEKEGHYPSN